MSELSRSEGVRQAALSAALSLTGSINTYNSFSRLEPAPPVLTLTNCLDLAEHIEYWLKTGRRKDAS